MTLSINKRSTDSVANNAVKRGLAVDEGCRALVDKHLRALFTILSLIMDRTNNNDVDYQSNQNNQNAEFIKNMIEGIDPFTTAQNTGAPTQTPSLLETLFSGSSY
ncbi:hypothetical protein F8M41_020310 [Gigaspora margarita]|uniref:Uncharacterized protein n=1 Tax=Gigaspora margarita TaxID=4874 RepID=A0A8H4AIK8_GIGMA|nr:hypothetical protein F8M41_020310 [Gigaspora margarita]